MEKIAAVHAVFVDMPNRLNEAHVAVDGLISIAASASIEQRAHAAGAQNRILFVKTFTEGFKDKLPTSALKYGLTISETAQTEFRVAVTDESTTCSLYGCASRFSLQGDLLDESGKSFWHFETKIGQSTIFAKIPELFDVFTNEVLNAMKKDGVIGG